MADNGSFKECPSICSHSLGEGAEADLVDQPSEQLLREEAISCGLERKRPRKPKIMCLDESCARKFTTMRKMRAHSARAHNLVDLQCVLCLSTFSREDNLKYHNKKPCPETTRSSRWTYKQSSITQQINKDQGFDQRVNCQERQSKIQTLQVI